MKTHPTKSTIKTQHSLGAQHEFSQNKARTLKQHDHQLRTAVLETCEELRIPDGIAESLAKAAVDRFVISSDGTVKPLSSYSNLESFVKAYRKAAPVEKTPAIKAADARAMKKKELFEQLQYFAETGDMKAYREIRTEYAKL